MGLRLAVIRSVGQRFGARDPIPALHSSRTGVINLQSHVVDVSATAEVRRYGASMHFPIFVGLVFSFGFRQLGAVDRQ